MSGRILVATDGSPGAREAVEVGVSLASHDQAEVVFLAVSAAPGDAPDADRALADASAVAAARGIPSSVVRRVGDPVEEIVRLASEQDASIVVVGSRGMTPDRSAALGRVSRAVMRRCNRPVLVARRTRAATD